jgi:RNA recognition motif-containing protein
MLKEEFAGFGEVKLATVIRDKYFNRSRGFGFVEMASDTEAEKAMGNMNGITLDGRRIFVNYARERRSYHPSRY